MKNKDIFFLSCLRFSYSKTKDGPLRFFLSRGAGVGKSIIANALYMYEALIRFLDRITWENPDDGKIVNTAPTGKAELNII